MTDLNNPLAVMAFDHRSSFAQLMGVTWPMTTPDRERAAHLKSLILAALEAGVSAGGPSQSAAGLVAEALGASVADGAVRRGLALAMPSEASGGDRLRMQYGSDFGAHLQRFRPNYV